MPYKVRAIEDLPEAYKADRLNIRFAAVAPVRVRRLNSVARSRELLKGTEPPLVEALDEGKKESNNSNKDHRSY